MELICGTKRWLPALALAILGLPVLSATAEAVLICGSGAHWIDTCLGDFDNFSSSATVGIDANFDGIAESIAILSGPTSVWRGDPIDTPDALDPGHLNTIETEIISLSLTGVMLTGPLAGLGVVLTAGDGMAPALFTGSPAADGASPDLFSPGEIIEKTGPGTTDCDFPADAALACSFFDVFFEINIENFGSLHNLDPLLLEAMIEGVPPFNVDYTHPIPDPIGLFDENGNLVAQLINASHTPIPEPGSWALFTVGLAGLGLMMRRRKKAA